MFRSATVRLVARVSDLIDDMLVGDFDYIYDGRDVYADVDYHREHPHHESALTWTPAAGRGYGPQRSAIAGPASRRSGAVPPREAVCISPVRSKARPTPAAARSPVSRS